MKNIILTIAAAALLSSCSDIATDERYLESESVAVQRAVLIEDFTGQKCINCPFAHETVEKLVEQYGDAVIPVSIHAGNEVYISIPADYKRYTGLKQPEGDTYCDAWGIEDFPKGVINRTGSPLNHEDWADAVRKQLALESDLNISVDADCYYGDKVNIALKLTHKSDVKGNLQVWILEDSIVARQEHKTLGLIRDYVHNHVYRASVNGVGGESISLTDDGYKTFDMSYDVRKTETETWVPENLSVVAFVYNESGVLQAAKSHVKVK